jgi:LmbE family N-acetylglucosaminyl deacetylase
MEIKNLVIAPHVDDEILGCGGILNSSFFVYFCGVDESRIRKDKDRTSTDQRFSELKKVSDFLGFKYECNESSKVNHYVEQDFIDIFEDLINRIKPEKIFLPHPGYNQDHRTIFNAAMIALRPHDKNFFVKKVLVYEAAHDVIWNPKKINLNYFVPIDIERKIKAYELYASQVRSMRSSQLLRDIAAVRGASSNCKYAEAFEILRWSEDEQK